jgi:hypothetical protein
MFNRSLESIRSASTRTMCTRKEEIDGIGVAFLLESFSRRTLVRQMPTSGALADSSENAASHEKGG